MRVLSYVGTEGHSIVIEKPEDLYPALDWLQSRIIELDENDPRVVECSNLISSFMDVAEAQGFGDCDNEPKLF